MGKLDFKTWCEQLQKYANSLKVGDAITDNEESFREYYEAGYSPENAMDEDISYWNT